MSLLSLKDWRPRGDQRSRLREHDHPEPLPAHVGLWLDRMLTSQRKKKDSAKKEASQEWLDQRRLFEVAVDALRPAAEDHEKDPPAVASYRRRFRFLQQQLATTSPGIIRRTVEVEARSRLLMHAASQNTVTEGSVLLHHTYGVPYLPGSALKGMIRARLKRIDPAWTDGFLGRAPTDEDDAATAALIDVFDALWIPQRPPGFLPTWSPLALDLINPHHREYYNPSAGDRAQPSDADDPIPALRLTVAPGTRFLIALEAPDEPQIRPWLDWLIEEVLSPALDEDGIGAWSSAGYGRLVKVGQKAPDLKPLPTSPAESSWYVTDVSRQPQDGTLSAQLPDGREAFAFQQAAHQLFGQLPVEIQERFKKKPRRARLELRIEEMGTKWQIVELRVPGSEP